MNHPVPAYAVAVLHDVDLGDAIISYLREIDATLAPFGGEFIVHGGHTEVLEGQFDGTLVMIRFPSREAAQGWYRSADYQRILPLRAEHSRSITFIVDGVKPGHTGAGKVQELLPSME